MADDGDELVLSDDDGSEDHVMEDAPAPMVLHLEFQRGFSLLL